MDILLLTLPLASLKIYIACFQHLVLPPLACPRCREKDKIIKYGHYYRIAVDLEGTKHKIPIQRFRCKICGKTFSYLPPFLSRYKPYCIHVVSPLIDANLTTPVSLSKLFHERYWNLPIEYQSIRLYLNNLVAKSQQIYSLLLSEFKKSEKSLSVDGDFHFIETPSYFKEKAFKKGLADLYRVYVITNEYLATTRTNVGKMILSHSSWLVLVNYILFQKTYSTIF